MQLHESILSKYSGPPGTGKSTTLLNIVDSLLEAGLPPEDIVFTTFTRAGANEARERACRRFNLIPDRLPYFRTLHSICLSLLDNKPVMTWADWFAIGDAIGLSFSVTFNPEEVIPKGQTKGDYLLALWSYSRVTRRHLDHVFDDRQRLLMGHEDVTREELHHFVGTVHNYKETHGKMDFTDMLEDYLIHGTPLHPRRVIIDEAQDLSLLQWEVVTKICEGAEAVYVAGDDDQCIHAWNGASPEYFIELKAKEYTVLPQSYRIPGLVHKLANEVIVRVHNRLPKDYRPREEPGVVGALDDLAQISMEEGTWLLLARNKCFLRDYVEHCKAYGLLYKGEGLNDIPKTALPAIRAWQALQAGKTITLDEARQLYDCMSQRDRVVRGFKTRLNAAKEPKDVRYEDLTDKFGLIAPRDLPWPQALDRIPEDARNYLMKVEQKSGLDAKETIEIGTIHSAKGKEADHVILRPEMTTRTWQAFEADPDAEHRCWYVGITRARKTLHILNSGHRYCYPL